MKRSKPPESIYVSTINYPSDNFMMDARWSEERLSDSNIEYVLNDWQPMETCEAAECQDVFVWHELFGNRISDFAYLGKCGQWISQVSNNVIYPQGWKPIPKPPAEIGTEGGGFKPGGGENR